MSDLQIGAEILREVLDRELEKEERAAQAKREEKAIAAAEKERVSVMLLFSISYSSSYFPSEQIKQQFYDDRKGQALRTAKERGSSTSIPTRRTSTTPATPTLPTEMPGTGHTLTGEPASIDNNDDED